ncbi:hydroxyisourate hydrolase [Gordonia jinhuaensis]|uniref:5-hydroxyisourate hydrolase n=1 Tax=Gordonia jinhuaensis TaxID=1517702 RepID=A0A916SWC4_9ACTN|nr:hydroxyisourate hydrolase [Gordonia jinhuaensis]GGB16695.1 5-hydroxyisourate hydrolase [Gordonia jinhuaensis]
MSLSTHVLDAVAGLPATGMTVTLHDDSGTVLATGVTDDDGRIPGFMAELPTGTYTIRFDTGAWFDAHGIDGFYPRIDICFEVTDAARHHHVPVLLSPFAYSTYRGS